MTDEQFEALRDQLDRLEIWIKQCRIISLPQAACDHVYVAFPHTVACRLCALVDLKPGDPVAKPAEPE